LAGLAPVSAAEKGAIKIRITEILIALSGGLELSDRQGTHGAKMAVAELMQPVG